MIWPYVLLAEPGCTPEKCLVVEGRPRRKPVARWTVRERPPQTADVRSDIGQCQYVSWERG